MAITPGLGPSLTKLPFPKVGAPAGEQQSAYLPKGPPEPLIFEEFAGINTSTSRVGVDDKQMFWCDGFMPIGPKFLRTLYGLGAANYTGGNIAFFDFANIGATPYMLVILSDGSIDAVNTDTSMSSTIAPAGTITNPSRSTVGLSQYGSQYVIFVAQQTNGYFLWDGTTFYKAGGLSPPITITNVGSGYTSAPAVAATGGSGTGATFTATVASGVITDIQITNPGTGYVAGDTVTLGITGGGGASGAATVTLMPFGISGTAVETYSGRVWVANGPTISFSAPGSVNDFSTASGGGNFESSDSFLRVSYIQLKQTNGFLYLVADSSVNYISGVQTAGSPPVTTFTNQNADPEVGTPYAATVLVFSRNILFANAFGAHISYGAAVTKISEPLDGIYTSIPNFGGFAPSSAKAIVFGKRVWILLLPIIDPISGQPTNKLFMWNGKIWWASSQDVELTYIQHQEINSVITAYGSDGSSIYPLFQQASTAFTKTAQSKLWTTPGGYQFLKATTRLWVLAQYYSLEEPDLRVYIDNENSTAENIFALGPPDMVWRTAAEVIMEWTTQGGDPMVWTASGLSVSDPTSVGQNGVLTGMTIETECADMALVSAMMHNELVAYRG